MNNRLEHRPTHLHIEQSKKNGEFYAQLDALGKTSQRIIDLLTEAATTGSIDITTLAEVFITDTTTLTNEQRCFLETFKDKLLRDQIQIQEAIDDSGSPKECIRRVLSKILTNEPPFSILDKAKMHPVIGGICVTLDAADYSTIFRDIQYQSDAIYIRDDHSISRLPGGVIILHSNTKDPIASLAHEQMHLIMHRYIQPNETPIPSSPEITQISQQIATLEIKLEELQEDNTLAETIQEAELTDQDLRHVQGQIDLLYAKKRALRIERGEHVDQTSKQLFLDIRDELCAYLQGGKLQTNKARLIPPGLTWEERIAAIPQPEQALFDATWEQLHMLLQSPYLPIIKDLFPIILSSQSLTILVERLQERVEAAVDMEQQENAERTLLYNFIDTWLARNFDAFFDDLSRNIPSITSLSQEDILSLRTILKPKLSLDLLLSNPSELPHVPKHILDDAVLQLNSSRLPSLSGQDVHIQEEIKNSPLYQVIQKIKKLHPDWNI
jgi:hypothetical protein